MKNEKETANPKTQSFRAEDTDERASERAEQKQKEKQKEEEKLKEEEKDRKGGVSATRRSYGSLRTPAIWPPGSCHLREHPDVPVSSQHPRFHRLLLPRRLPSPAEIPQSCEYILLSALGSPYIVQMQALSHHNTFNMLVYTRAHRHRDAHIHTIRTDVPVMRRPTRAQTYACTCPYPCT
jgi:hypothetical protein